MKKNIKVESLCTFRCNCNCIMCSVATKNNQDKTEESFKEVKRDIDIAAKLGANTFAFSGGEPTLREDLLQLVRYARKKIPNIEIQSNGRMYYYKNYCQKLIEAGVKNFVISLHSPYEDISDRIMGARGAYLQTITGIKNLKNLKQKVKINTVILKLN